MVLDEWIYPQLKHFMTTLLQPIRSEENLNSMEQLFNLQTKLKHGISQIYKILMRLEGPGIPPFTEKWEKELESRLKSKK